MNLPAPIFWEQNQLYILDQTLLPHRTEKRPIPRVTEAAEAIQKLRVRGAPAIGILAAHAVFVELRAFLAEQELKGEAVLPIFLKHLETVCVQLNATRPTAVNLAHALNAVRDAVAQNSGATVPELLETIRVTAETIHRRDAEICKKLGELGSTLIAPGARVMTHCNAGAMATGGIGTALAAFFTAREQNKDITVFSCETRPLLQGARITVWELQQADVRTFLITDNMAAFIMQNEKIDLVLTGADRIACNGDAANKIGTCGLAILAKYFGIPFYIAAPETTVDRQTATGAGIPIEERNPDEVRGFRSELSAPADVPVRNPAFDVTPADLIAGIITETGIHRPPYDFSV